MLVLLRGDNLYTVCVCVCVHGRLVLRESEANTYTACRTAFCCLEAHTLAYWAFRLSAHCVVTFLIVALELSQPQQGFSPEQPKKSYTSV